MPKVISNAVSLAKDYIARALSPGGIAVDATAGKGSDTVFLASLVGPAGLVYSFDIQKQALAETAANIKKNNLVNVKLIKAGHEQLDLYIKEPIDAVMFNLGYLPGGNHSIVTTPQTSGMAVTKTLKMLKPGGIMTIVLYTGHPGGNEEKEQLEDILYKLDQKEFHLLKVTYPNQKNNPPYLLVVQKTA